jgi:hypothetical protein
VDASSHRALTEFVREATVEERDELIRLSLAVERIEERLGLRKPPPKTERESRRFASPAP